MNEDELVEHVARAIFEATLEPARKQSQHVASWESIPEWWRVSHRRSARAAIAAVREAGGLF